MPNQDIKDRPAVVLVFINDTFELLFACWDYIGSWIWLRISIINCFH